MTEQQQRILDQKTILRQLEPGTLRDIGIDLTKSLDRQQALERQYSQQLGRLAQLCNTVIPHLLGCLHESQMADLPEDVTNYIAEIMGYVEAAPMIPQPIQSVIDDLTALFKTKNVEYKGNTPDLFRNFNQGAALSSETPEQVLLGYVNKQIVSLYDAKNHHPERLTDVNFINEKAQDIAVYMIILTAMVRSQRHSAP